MRPTRHRDHVGGSKPSCCSSNRPRDRDFLPLTSGGNLVYVGTVWFWLSFPRHVLQLDPCTTAGEQGLAVVWRIHPGHLCVYPCGACSLQTAPDTAHPLRWCCSHQGRAAELEIKEIKRGVLPSIVGNTMATWYSGSALNLLSRARQAACTHMFRHVRSHTQSRTLT